MSTDAIGRGHSRVLGLVIPLAIFLLPLVIGLAAHVVSAREDVPDGFLERPDEGAGTCDGRDIGEMRFHHMDLLKKIRDQALRDGVRGETQFNDCMRCHQDRRTFCDRCHDAVDLYPDCFGCHDPRSLEVHDE